MFEGSNKNLIAYKFKNMKNQQFIYDTGRNLWINDVTKRAAELSKDSEAKPNGNIETAKIRTENGARQKWTVKPCDDATDVKQKETKKQVPKAPADDTDEDDDAKDSRLQKSVPTHETRKYAEAKTDLLNKLVARLDDEVNKREESNPIKHEEHHEKASSFKEKDAERVKLEQKLRSLED